MKKSVEAIFIFSSVLFVISSLFLHAQTPAENVTGKIYRKSDHTGYHFQIINNLKDSEKNYFDSMKTNMFRIFKIAIDVPAVNPPRGFDIAPSFTAFKYNTSKNFQGWVSLACYTYYHDANNPQKIHKGEKSHGGLGLYINQIRSILPQTDNYKYQVDSNHVYYILPKIKKAGSDQIYIGKHILILKKKDRPVFIPMTKKEFIHYRIRVIKHSLANMVQNIKLEKMKIIRRYNDSLSSMPEQELQEPAYAVLNLSRPDLDIYNLCSPADPNANGFYMVNTGYYDSYLSPTDIQLIMVYYDASNFCPAFAKRTLNNWFHQINYKRLIALIH